MTTKKKWNHISYLLRSPTSVKILKVLSSSQIPMTTVQIGKVVKISKSNISPKLQEMKRRGLVNCLNPEASSWRFYEITKEGKRILEETQKYTNKRLEL